MNAPRANKTRRRTGHQAQRVQHRGGQARPGLGLIAGLVACFTFGQARGDPGAGPLGFQPGFHQAMRNWTWRSPLTTFRIKIPIGRSGNRVRVSFKSGDGPLEIRAATIARAGSGGALASDPVPITFDRSPGVSLGSWQRKTSDLVQFAVDWGSDVYVSFEFEGAAAATTINAFPESYEWTGGHAADVNPPPGRPLMKASGINTVDVEAPLARAFVAIGDSITEGYISSDLGVYVAYNDDTRNAWPAVAQGILRLPFANAAVSGQGLDDALAALGTDALVLEGITDCLVLMGTNDLSSKTADEIQARLAALFDRLRSFCRVWSGTLPPRDGDQPAIAAKRRAVNDWIRHRASIADAIDFEAIVTSPEDPNRFRAGLGFDGIHPTVQGQRLMGTEAARVVSPPGLLGLSPDSAAAEGGTTVVIDGAGFKPGATVYFGSIPAPAVEFVSSNMLRARVPPHPPGRVDVTALNHDGLSSTMARAFGYQEGPAPGGIAPEPDPRPSPPAASPSHGCSSANSVSSDPAVLAALLLSLFVRRGKRPANER